MSEQAFVAYTPDVEQTQPGEEETLVELDEAFRKIQEHVRQKHGIVQRGTHAKPTGLLKGRMIVEAGLPPELAQGIFSKAGHTYEVVGRTSQGPSEYLSDKASGQRGLAFKILGVQGIRVPGSSETTTQDFVFGVHDTAFTDATSSDFLKGFNLAAGRSTWIPEAAIVAGSRLARGTEAVLETVGSGSAHLRFFGKKPSHPLSDRYFSQSAFRYGKYIAKIGAVPSESTLAAIGSPDVDTSVENVYEHVMSSFLSEHTAVFDIRVQLCTDLLQMPVEDSAKVWPEDVSPYRTVAKLEFPRQNPFSTERFRYVEDRISFNPIHAIEEHRALGSINRARAHVYLRTQEFRQQSNSVRSAEPRTLSDMPD